MFLEGMGCKEHPFSEQGGGRIPLPHLPLWVSGATAQVPGVCRTPWPVGPRFLPHVARLRAAVPDSRAGLRPGARMRSAGCGLARYHPSARSEEMTTARLLAGFPWEIATARAEIPVPGTTRWGGGSGRDWESACWRGARGLRGCVGG